jgi:hypothetical protein
LIVQANEYPGEDGGDVKWGKSRARSAFIKAKAGVGERESMRQFSQQAMGRPIDAECRDRKRRMKAAGTSHRPGRIIHEASARVQAGKD